MSVFGYAAAGALQGLGTGMKERALAKREAGLELVRQKFALNRDQTNRDFQRSEREASQEFTAGQNAAKLEVEREISGAKAISKASADSVKAESDLRDEYEKHPLTKEFDLIDNSFRRIRGSVENPSPAGDIGIVFGYMKLLDPASTVREGEFATAEQAGGVPEKIWSLYNRMLNGERLAPEVRKDFYTSAEKIFNASSEKMFGLNDRYSGLAGQYQYDPSRVVRKIPTYERIKFDRKTDTNTKVGDPSKGPVDVDGYRIEKVQ